MKVSVITTTFNDADNIDLCLSSIDNQLVKGFELEHIIWDDGSTEVETLYTKTERYNTTVYTGNDNQGLPAARNSAIDKTDNDAVLFLDADDWFSRTAVLNMVKASKGLRSPVYPSVQMWGESSSFISKPEWTKEAAMKQLFIPSSSLVMRSDFDSVGGFTTGLPLLEDFDLWFRLAREGFTGKYCPRALLHYNIRKDSMSDHFNLINGGSIKKEIYNKIVNQ